MVLYVGGYGRSGSTLVGRVLGEPEGAVCVGETRYLWTRGLQDNVECGCGEPFLACPFWGAVGEEAFGGWDRLDVEHLAELDREVVLLRTLPLHWAPLLRPGFARTIEEYASYLDKLYAAIGRVSGAAVIVDISKEPNFALLLTRLREVDVRVIHLVRDSRAVAYSWTRSKKTPGAVGEERLMPRFTASETATRWMLWNAAFHALAVRQSPYMRLVYERFVADPRRALGTIDAFAGFPLSPTNPEFQEGRVELGGHHMFSGNPMRANTGLIEIKPDNEWQRMQPSAQFAQVSAITWPLLRFYGYPVTPGGRRNGTPRP
jgi:Sulfotransferase family